MLCLIAGHFGNNLITRVVFTFHVPVFFIISGYFFVGNRVKIKRTIFKLIKPYIFTTLVMMLLEIIKECIKSLVSHTIFVSSDICLIVGKWVLAGLYGSGSRKDFLQFTMPTIGAIWFYLALIWTELFAYILLATQNRHLEMGCNHRKGRAVIVAIGSIVLWLSGYYSAFFTWLPLSIQSGLCGVIFLVIGIVLRKHQDTFESKRPIIVAVSIVIWIFSIIFSICNNYMSLVKCSFPNPIINMSGAICATIVLAECSKQIENTKLGKTFQFFGKNSMIVLSFHIIELKLIPWSSGVTYIFEKIGLQARTEFVIVTVFLLKIIWSVMGVIVAHKIHFLRKIYSIT